MINQLVVIALVVAATVILCHSAIFTIHNATISVVTVFGDVAQVTRSFVIVNPPEGLNFVVVSNLPNSVDGNSIKMTGGGGKIYKTLMSLKNSHLENEATFIKIVSYLENFRAKIADQIPQLADERRAQGSRDAVNTISAMLDNLHRNGIYKNLFINTNGGWTYSEFTHPHLFHELRSLPVQEKYWPGNKEQSTLEIYFVVLPFQETAHDREMTFTFKHTAAPAHWQPEYDVRVESTGSATSSSSTSSTGADVQVGMSALVTQSSPEDWVNATLHVSTAIAPVPATIDYLGSDAPNNSGVNYFVFGIPSVRPCSMPTFPPPFPYPLSGGVPLKELADAPAAERKRDRAHHQLLQWALEHKEPRDHAVTIGQIGGIFASAHPATVPSSNLNGKFQSPLLPREEPADSKSTSVFVRDIALQAQVFTCVKPRPSSSTSSPSLRAWRLPDALTPFTSDNSMLLLASNNTRVFIEGNYVSDTSMPHTQLGAALRLDLGSDRNLKVHSNFVTRRRSFRSSGKSEWFTRWFTMDKVTHKEELFEYTFTVQSTHAEPHLVVLHDYLPDMDIADAKLELLQPAPSTIVTLNRHGVSEDIAQSAEERFDVWTEDEFIAAVLEHPSLTNVAAQEEHIQSKLHTFMSKDSRHLAWAQWMQPGQQLRRV